MILGDERRESVEEYEVELVDYLRVMWKGKWVIVACFVVALGVAAGVTWTRPPQYSETVSYRFYERLSSFVDAQELDLIDRGSATAAGRNEEEVALLLGAVQQADVSSLGSHLRLASERKGDSLQVTLSGAGDPESLLEALDRLNAAVTEYLSAQMRVEKERVSSELELRIARLDRQRDELRERMGAIESRDDPLLPYLAEKVVEYEARLVEGEVGLESLRSAPVTDLFALEEVSRSPISQIGPSRRLNLAVGGVLGLFVGVLLVFFLHYLAGVKERERPRAAL